MDEVSDEKGMEINDESPYDPITMADRKHRVIRDMFIISYSKSTYKKIQMIMVCHLEINVNRNLNVFTDNRGVLAHYIPPMILSHMNWDYNKHFQVEFGASVQAPQVNHPNNTTHIRTPDRIYLCHAPNLQGGHQIMDRRIGRLIIRSKVVDITITDVVINAVEKWWSSRDLIHSKIIIKKRKE